ncbi:hypothetical protein [Streptomyces poriferorum]|uniref:Uncharacterized protein n=1 Tax=Streptomyces poriferorum TaxID=2798799 RepID=A0ABY9J7D7_9ACTN|nr:MULTISPECIES: hypothetical protein [unclassified Streptomyces]MDP5317347.1 hypothetical protein [Streptomyces sp. Alt4]WLQ62037.1 hypothetical protein P8A19_41935 [Streptomyces sp. Alt2]
MSPRAERLAEAQSRETDSPVRPTTRRPPVIPYITQRMGEEAAPDNLVLLPSRGGVRGRERYRLFYADEEARLDRDLRQVLWARVSFNPYDQRQHPTGDPEWKLMHPFRQRMAMEALRCQICMASATTPLGTVFLAGAHDYERTEPPLLTNQPPVCPKHIRTATSLCAHLRTDPVVFLATSAPLYGVLGTLYGLVDGQVQVVTQPKAPLPYGHPNLPTFLASQLVRRMARFRVLTVPQVLRVLAELPG